MHVQFKTRLYMQFTSLLFCFRLYPAGINIVSLPLTTLRSTRSVIMKNPVPIVKAGRQKQLFFLNFNVDGNRYMSLSDERVYV